MSQIPVAKPSGGGPPRPGLSKIATATGQSSFYNPHPQKEQFAETMGKYHESVHIMPKRLTVISAG
jgi:hypothetical protein